MTRKMPTGAGDAIVLKRSGTAVCMVCFVLTDRQQSYGDVSPEQFGSEASAMEAAQNYVSKTKGRIFISDSDGWSKIPD